GAVSFRGGQGAWRAQLTEQAWLLADAVNATWDFWVLGYSAERQLAFLRGLGLDADSWEALVPLLAGGVGLLLGLIGWGIVRRPGRPLDPAALAYRRFCAKLAQRGLGRGASEGPRDYAARVAAVRPELAAAVARITGLYVGLRYAATAAPGSLEELRRAVRAFRP
ncbi:MAG TPA: DUF4129 domain-containing protein, partial [Gammaproteobacteria bacterium]